MRPTTLLWSGALVFLINCNPTKNNKENPSLKEELTIANVCYTFNPDYIFPNTGELIRPEDGVSLPNGNIIVSDQANGLRMIEPNGANRNFGNFASVNYADVPVEKRTAPNGVFLESNGEYILMADLSDGKIYRIHVESEEVSLIYDHPYGVNAVYRDKTGALWFTQSTRSANMLELFRDINNLVPHGAIFRMADLNSDPVLVVDSLYLANGLTMDKDEKFLYVAETMMDRIHKYEVDLENGTLNYSGVAVHVGTPDNIKMDSEGRLLVASPIYNKVIRFDLENQSSQVLFDGSTKDNSAISNEWTRRSHLGIPRGELLTAEMFEPLPGLITGMFLSQNDSILFISNLGVDLLKLEIK